MPNDLLTYYESELSFLRQIGAEFAANYPKIASRLLLEADTSEDPHVERLIQAVAFLTARVHHKMDDEFSEITDALLGILYPHYLAPIPSMSIVQFVVDAEQVTMTSGYPIKRGTMLYSQPVRGFPCRFQTCYPITLWPLEVTAARLTEVDRQGPPDALTMLRLELRCPPGTALSELEIDHLRFFLHGETTLVYALYELLLNNTCQIQLRPLQEQSGVPPIILSADDLRPVGFGPDEGLLPYPPRSFMGYRLVQEYFTFAWKYLFVDLCGLERVAQAGFRGGMEVCIFLNREPRLGQPVTADTFRLGCAPIVNLFTHIAEPIRVTHAQTEYRVIPDVRRQEAMEVYSVDTVTCTSPQLDEPQTLQPFYALRHAVEHEPQQAFWYPARRASQRKGDAGTEVYLSLADRNFRPTLPAAETLTIHTTCTNRDLPGKLPFGGVEGDFELEGAAPVTRIRCLTKPTETIRAPLRSRAQWRLISHLSLNYLSIVEGGREALQEILTLYDFSDSAVLRQQIAGITGVTSRRVIGRPRELHDRAAQFSDRCDLTSMPWNGFCRGLEVRIEFDEDKYVGSGVFLFASVLEKFLGLYTSLNSFTQVIATTRQREEPLKQWPLRAGEQILL